MIVIIKFHDGDMIAMIKFVIAFMIVMIKFIMSVMIVLLKFLSRYQKKSKKTKKITRGTHPPLARPLTLPSRVPRVAVID